jgi:hypothetical protein
MKKGKINMLEVLSFCKENIVGLEPKSISNFEGRITFTAFDTIMEEVVDFEGTAEEVLQQLKDFETSRKGDYYDEM